MSPGYKYAAPDWSSNHSFPAPSRPLIAIHRPFLRIYLTMLNSLKPPRWGASERALQKCSLPAQFRAAHDAQLSSLELGLGADVPGHLSVRPSASQREELDALREEFGIETPTCHLTTRILADDPSNDVNQLTLLKEQIQVLSDLNIASVNLILSDAPSASLEPADTQRALEGLGHLAEFIDRQAIRLALLTNATLTPQAKGPPVHVETLMTSRSFLAQLVKQLPASCEIGYEPAMFKAVNPSDLRFGFDLVQSRTAFCILHDWRETKDGPQSVFPGQDDLDFGRLFQGAKTPSLCLVAGPVSDQPADGFKQSKTSLERQITLWEQHTTNHP